MTGHLLTQSLLLILAAAVAVGLFAAWRMPAAMGYLLAGLAIGPHGLNLVPLGDDTRFLAELGLILLMFMVGLEFSLGALLAARTDVLLAGSLQVGATLATIAAALWWLGLELRLAILLGGAAAMSSTAVAVKQLAEQGEISSQHGRFTVGILLFQDVATIPLLVAVDSWSRQASVDPFDLVQRLGLAAIALVAVAIIARPLVRTMLAGAARSRSGEAFPPDGASRGPRSRLFRRAHRPRLADRRVHRRRGDRRKRLPPPRGRRLASVPRRSRRPVLRHCGHGDRLTTDRCFPGTILVWCLVFLFGKAVITFIVGLALRRSAATALRVAIILAHGGEFGLLLASLSMNTACCRRTLAHRCSLLLRSPWAWHPW